MCKVLIALFIVFLAWTVSPVKATETVQDKNQLTVWLIPFDPPFKTTWAEERMPVKKQLDSFNRKWAASNITVLNTTVDWMVDQLVVWNPEYDLPNWSVVRGQERTLETLGGFAGKNGVHLNVRFLTWKTVLSALMKLHDTAGDKALKEAKSVPDVVQIGSTWAAHFADKKLSLAPPGAAREGLTWRSIDEIPVSLPYTIDVRLLFYWKKLPGNETAFGKWLKDAPDWREIVEALSKIVLNRHNPAPPMVMPTGLTFNLFHDYVPLVWASGSPFFEETIFGTRTDMGDKKAMKIPLLISKNATTFDANGRAYRCISFPEMSQESAARHFMKGLEYVAVVQPASFLSEWRRNFMKYVSVSPRTFWESAGVAVLPTVYKGGSDLVVVKGTQKEGLAFSLIRYLATDETHSGVAAENGYLPAQALDFGLNALLVFLGGPSSEDAKNAVVSIHRAIEKGREYPPIPDLPHRVESMEMLEAIQMLWRRIGEGDAERVERYAKKVALKINSLIYWPSHLWVMIKKLWPVIASTFGLFFLGLYLQSRKIAWRNRLLRIAVDSLRRRDYVLVSRAGAFVSDCQRAPEQACADFSDALYDLRTRTLRLENNIRGDLEHSGRRRFPVSLLIKEAWENALSQYRLAYPESGTMAEKPVLNDDLENHFIHQLPYVLVAMAQDWFYNAMKNDLYDADHTEISLWPRKGKKDGLTIFSPFRGTDVPSKQLFGPLPRRAFELMCEQSKAAYGRPPALEELEKNMGSRPCVRGVVLFFPVPVTRK